MLRSSANIFDRNNLPKHSHLFIMEQLVNTLIGLAIGVLLRRTLRFCLQTISPQLQSIVNCLIKNFPFKVIHITGKFAVARVVFSEISKDNSSLAADDDDADDDCDHVCCRRDVYSNHCSSLFLLYYSFHKTSTEIKNRKQNCLHTRGQKPFVSRPAGVSIHCTLN